MPLPCAICQGSGYVDNEPKKHDYLPDIPPSNEIPVIDLQVKPKTQQQLLNESVNEIKNSMIKKKSMKRYRIQHALRHIGKDSRNIGEI